KRMPLYMCVTALGRLAAKDRTVMLRGNEYRNAASIMPFLVFTPIFYTISETTVIGINFYKRTKWHILIAIIACIINIIGNLLLVPNYGAIGASLSTAFAYILFFTLRTQISLKFYKVKYPLFKIYIMALLVSCYAIYSIFSSSIWLNIALGLVSTTILVLLFYKDLMYIFRNRKELLK